MIEIKINIFDDNDWLEELQKLLFKADGQGIREDISSMTTQELYELYRSLKSVS